MGIETNSINKKVDASNKGLKARKDKVQLPPSKIVIRRLPQSFTEEDFINVIAPVPENNFFCFVPADKRLRQYGYSRAYINFTDTEEIFNFRDKFDGYVFVDQKGNEYPAIVEYAPFQKIPKPNNSQKKDPRCGTIIEDTDYVQFLNNLENPEVVILPQIETLLEEIENNERELRANNGILKIKTPLLEFIEQRNANKLRPGERKRRKELERKQAREEAKRKRKESIRDWRYTKKEEVREDRKKWDDDQFKYDRSEREEKDKRFRKDRMDREKSEDKVPDIDNEKKKIEQTSHSNEEVLPVNPKKETDTKSKFDQVKSKRYSEGRKKDDKKVKNEILEDPEPIVKDEKEPYLEIILEKQDVTNTDSSMQEDRSQSSNDMCLSNNDQEASKQTDDDSKNSDFGDNRKENELRKARRIKNKDRPAMQLYRPGQSRLKTGPSKQDDKGNYESTSSSSSPDIALMEEKKEESTSGEDIRKEGEMIKEGEATLEEAEILDTEEIRSEKIETDIKKKEIPVEETLLKEKAMSNEIVTKTDKKKFTKGRYFEENFATTKSCLEEERGYGKYNEDSGRYDNKSGVAGRKGYSYHQERENKAKLKNKDQDSIKSKTPRRSTSQE